MENDLIDLQKLTDEVIYELSQDMQKLYQDKVQV